MSDENREGEQEQTEGQKPYIIIEFDGIDSSVCRVTPSKHITLSQMELAAFRLNTVATRAVNDRYTMEVQQQAQQQMQLQSIMHNAKLKTQ